MKKLFLMASAALLFTGAAFADGGKKCKKKNCKDKGAACCKKDGKDAKSCSKEGKEGKEGKKCCSKDKSTTVQL